MDNKDFSVEEYVKYLEQQSVTDRVKRVNNTINVLTEFAELNMEGEAKKEFLDNMPKASSEEGVVLESKPQEELDIDMQ